MSTSRRLSFHAGANGRLSRYPFAAVATAERGTALGIDMAFPAFYRAGCNAATGELFLACDLGLTPEKPSARLRFCSFSFASAWGFRAALDPLLRSVSRGVRALRVQRRRACGCRSRGSADAGWGFRFRVEEGTTGPRGTTGTTCSPSATPSP
ncbi:MAG: hypothetical protein U1F77_15585 [Kiritimatiellia bacterium]